MVIGAKTGLLKSDARACFWNVNLEASWSRASFSAWFTVSSPHSGHVPPTCNAVCCSVLQCVAVRCRALQCVAASCIVNIMISSPYFRHVPSVLQCLAVCYSVLQCVAARCRVLQCVAAQWGDEIMMIHRWLLDIFPPPAATTHSMNTRHHTATYWTHCTTCCMVSTLHSGWVPSTYNTSSFLNRLTFAIIRDCNRETATERLQQRGCNRETAIERLQRRDCNREAAPEKLQQRDCNRETATKRLQQRECSSKTATGRLHRRDCNWKSAIKLLYVVTHSQYMCTHLLHVIPATAVRCSVLQCVAVRCSALQCVAVRCSALQDAAVCCSALQCGSVCWCVITHQLRLIPATTTQIMPARNNRDTCFQRPKTVQASYCRLHRIRCTLLPRVAVCCSVSVLQCVAVSVCCSVLQCQCVAVCCSVLQCQRVAVCCSVLQCHFLW